MLYFFESNTKNKFNHWREIRRGTTNYNRLKPGKDLVKRIHLTCKRDPVDVRDYMFRTISPKVSDPGLKLPSFCDHTNDMSPVKDQGELGSCVGFAVAAMKEAQEKKEHEADLARGKPGEGKDYNYSEAWIYWNSKRLDPWPDEEGTSIRFAMQVLQRKGVPTEKAWPYRDIGDIGRPENWSKLIARWALIGSYWRIYTLTELKVALLENPVVIGIPCFYEIFFVGQDGIVHYPANTRQVYGGHAVCAIGYSDSTQLVKFKNSWGKKWGANGYGYLPYKYIEDFLWDAWAAKDISVTNEMLKGQRKLVE